LISDRKHTRRARDRTSLFGSDPAFTLFAQSECAQERAGGRLTDHLRRDLGPDELEEGRGVLAARHERRRVNSVLKRELVVVSFRHDGRGSEEGLVVMRGRGGGVEGGVRDRVVHGKGRGNVLWLLWASGMDGGTDCRR
jgi:hypothetical protein